MSFGSSSTTQKTSGTSDSNRTFDLPEARSILQALSGVYGNAGLYGNNSGMQALQRLNDEASLGNSNPYLDNLIAANNQEGQVLLDANLAKARAGGYRGGTGANLLNQGLIASDFANRQSNSNTALRYQDAQNQQNWRLGLANALTESSVGNTQAGLALLNLLAGSSTRSTGENKATGSNSGFDLGSILGGAGSFISSFGS